jgi:GNAT superfamily N-acetyltransferase
MTSERETQSPSFPMTTLTYCKRLRMEIDLRWIEPTPALPLGYVWVPWDDAILKAHAEVKWRSFRGELDTRVFPNLSCREGCLQLMKVIREMPGFLPEATWLISAIDGCCGTVQGIRDDSGLGMIQNLGVVPEHRGRKLGKSLLLKALQGFRQAGLKRAFLEVSARNTRAVRLYHQTGFVTRKTLYREIAPVDEESYII